MIAQILKDIPHEIKQIPAKEALLPAGETASNIFIVKSGCVRCWYNDYGKDVTLQFFIRIFAQVKSFDNHETFNRIYCNMFKFYHGIMHKHFRQSFC